MTETLVTVGLNERSYPIHIRSGLLADIGMDLQEKQFATRYGGISDEYVAGLYGESLLQSLSSAGIQVELITFPRGEESKNL